LLAGTNAHASVEGYVYVDADHDGARSAGDPPVAGVRVWLDDSAVALTGADGAYRLEGAGGGIVWVQTVDGFAPGPVWRAVGRDTEIDLALVKRALQVPLTFVVSSDAHVGKEFYGGGGTFDAAALQAALAQALDRDPPPAFLAMTGDITNRSTRAETDAAAKVLRGWADLTALVPVAGNHDWVDGGEAFRAVFGPSEYSFDLGGVHFVVLDDNPKKDPDLAFLKRDLEGVTDDRLVIAFVHRPPKDRAFEALEAAGVDYLFTGHWHANRYVRGAGGMVEINTEPIVRGGLDFTPAGFRVVTVSGRAVTIDHETVVEHAVAAVVWPGAMCVPAGPLRAIVAIAPESRAPVRVGLDGGGGAALESTGGWDHAGDVGAVAAGEHTLAIEGGATARFATCADAPAPVVGAWTQHQGGPEHHGASATPIAPPLRGLWATSIGGYLQGGSVAVADGRVFVPYLDLADGTHGGVVALDAATGVIQWRHLTGHSVRGTPAVADGVVVIGSNDGVLHAIDAATGAVRWTYDLGAGVDDNRSALTASPTIAGGLVLAGVIGRFAALELATGAVRWEAKPAQKMIDQHSYGAAAVVGDVVIAPFGLGGDGMVAWDVRSGGERWRLGKDPSTTVHASPIVDGDRVLVVNSSTVLYAVSAADGRIAWQQKIDGKATAMSMASAATPALADGLLFVPTQYAGLAAFDLTTQRVRWRLSVGESNVHVAHNLRLARSVPGSPVVAGDWLWMGDADGVLRAIEPGTGEVRWSADLGAPILSGLAAAGEVLFVGTYDGTLRAYATDPTAPPIAHGAPRRGGVDPATRMLVGALALFAMLVLGAITWRAWRR
jgi:outer membrane protein assembly factor BamB